MWGDGEREKEEEVKEEERESLCVFCVFIYLLQY